MENGSNPSTNGSNGRDAQGRFTKGNPGGPGNPFARQVATLRCELVAAVTPKDIREIVRGLLKLAKKGDVGAARLVLGYSIGATAAAPDPDTLDERELKNEGGYYRAEHEMHRQKPDIVDRIRWSSES